MIVICMNPRTGRRSSVLCTKMVENSLIDSGAAAVSSQQLRNRAILLFLYLAHEISSRENMTVGTRMGCQGNLVPWVLLGHWSSTRLPMILP